ncbi:hypothetical protein DEH80_16650 [Abyssibacter profundi]|uniref:Type I secretion protein TolC n=1 Tax=Abyssibacter profundi TaxID=2182787 RepID=A0A383XPN5_9GAMM|nr:hypothetical protein DEH80_16650 [Abyssibacter profundi]
MRGTRNQDLRHVLFAVGALGALGSAQAAELLDSYKLALRNDPQLQAAAAERDALIETKPQARAAVLPQLSFSGQMFRNRREQTIQGQMQPINISTDSQFGLTLNQALFDWTAFRQLNQSESRVAAAEAGYLADEQGLVLRVAEAYFDAVAAADALEFAVAEKRAISRQLEQAQKRFEVGLSAITDVQEAQARYDLTVAEEIEANRTLRTAQEALREITGVYPSNLPGLKADMPLTPPAPAKANAWVENALNGNLELAEAILNVDIAQGEIRAQEGGRLPTLGLQAGAGYSDQGGAFGSETESASIGLLLDIPLYTGGRTSSLIRESKSRYIQQTALAEQTRRAVERQARDAYDGVLAGISRVKALGQAVKSSQTALEASEAGYRVGTRTSVDVLDAQRELYAARRDYARARYDYLINLLRLKQSTGQLLVDDLAEIDRLLASNGTATESTP